MKTIKIWDEKGIGTVGLIIFVAIAAAIIFVIVQFTGSTTNAGKFETAVGDITLEGMNKSDNQLQKEISDQAKTNGVSLNDEGVKIAWGPNRDYLELTIDYTVPINLVVYKFDRIFNFYTKRELSYPKQIMNQVERKVQGSYDTMVDRARRATQDSGSPPPKE